MKAILKRELSAYFNSLIGYIFLTAFFAASGVLFSITSLQYGSTDMGSMFSMLFFVLLVLIHFSWRSKYGEQTKYNEGIF